jgi:hypothetical protein
MTVIIDEIVQNGTWEIKNVPIVNVGHKTKVDEEEFSYSEELISSPDFLQNVCKVSLVDEHPNDQAKSGNIKKFGHASKAWYSKADKTVYADLVITDEEGKKILESKKGFSIANYTSKKGNIFDHIAITNNPLFKEAKIPDYAFTQKIAKNSVDKSINSDNSTNNHNNNSMPENKNTDNFQNEVMAHIEVDGKEHKVPQAVKNYIASINQKVADTEKTASEALEKFKKESSDKFAKVTGLYNKFIKKVPGLAMNSEVAGMEKQVIDHANKCLTENPFELDEKNNNLVKTFFKKGINTSEDAESFFDLCESLSPKKDEADSQDKGEDFSAINEKRIAKNSGNDSKKGIVPETYRNPLF